MKQKIILTGLAALSGLLLALAYPGWGFDLGWLVWIGFIPLFFALELGLPRPGLGNPRPGLGFGFKTGFVAGLVYFLIIFWWFWSIYPLDTLGIENSFISFIAVLLVYLISSAGMAVFWGLFGAVYSLQLSVTRKIKKGLNSENPSGFKLKPENWSLFTVPAIFVLLEYLRSWGFGFLWAGSGSLFGPHWTFGNLAYALASNPLALKLASLVGIYGITFMIVLINLLLVGLISRHRMSLGRSMSQNFKKLIPAIIIFTAVVLTFWKWPAAISTSDKFVNFAVVQTAQPTKATHTSKEILSGLEEQLKLLARVTKEHPESQLIVFPETSELFKNISLFMTSAQVQKYFSNLFKEPTLIIAGGRIFDANGQYYSRVFNLDTQNDILNYYDKRILTPGGEFLPYPIKLIAWIFSKTTTSQFDSLRELNVGDKDVSTVNFRDQFKVAPMICSELLSPGLTKQTSQNSDIIVSMASYGIFHGSPVITRQMMAATRFRAAETAKPIVTAANLGRSYAIDSQGNITYLAPSANPQILTGSVAINQQKSWYNRVGDIHILAGSLVLIAYFTFFSILKHKKGNFNV